MSRARGGLHQGPLALAVVVERDADPELGEVRFETARPVTFSFIRNTEKSPHLGDQYGQDIEPAGRYMLHRELAGQPPRGWVTGLQSFRQPIVLEIALDGRIYGPTGWKARLVQASGGKKGRALSRYLKSLGYDGIVTVQETRGQRSTAEIVAL